MIRTTVLILTFQRPLLLERCLESVLQAKANLPDPSVLEVLTVLNGDDPAAEQILQRHPGIRRLKIGSTTNGEARNHGLRAAQGEYVCFLDDDLTVPPGYFRIAHALIDEASSPPDVLGGPDQTPPDSGVMERAIGHSLASPWVTGPTFRRHHPAKSLSRASEKDLILCNLWIRRPTLTAAGLGFDSRLKRNEENLLIASLPAEASIVYRPELRVYHRRRKRFADFAGQVRRSGESRARMILLKPRTLRWYYLTPSAFLLTLFVLRLPLLALHAGLAILIGLAVAIRAKDPRAMPWTIVIHLTVHWIYGGALLLTLARHFVPIGSVKTERHTLG